MTLLRFPLALLWTLVSPSADPLVIHARSAMYALQPAPKSPEIADAIVTVVRWRGPLPGLTEAKSVDVMLAIAKTEGDFDNGAIGDHGSSRSSFQILGAPKHFSTDVLAATRHAYEMVRASFRACGKANPLGLYTRGKCASARGKQLGDVKMNLAKQIGGG